MFFSSPAANCSNFHTRWSRLSLGNGSAFISRTVRGNQASTTTSWAADVPLSLTSNPHLHSCPTLISPGGTQRSVTAGECDPAEPNSLSAVADVAAGLAAAGAVCAPGLPPVMGINLVCVVRAGFDAAAELAAVDWAGLS